MLIFCIHCFFELTAYGCQEVGLTFKVLEWKKCNSLCVPHAVRVNAHSLVTRACSGAFLPPQNRCLPLKERLLHTQLAGTGSAASESDVLVPDDVLVSWPNLAKKQETEAQSSGENCSWLLPTLSPHIPENEREWSSVHVQAPWNRKFQWVQNGWIKVGKQLSHLNWSAPATTGKKRQFRLQLEKAKAVFLGGCM